MHLLFVGHSARLQGAEQSLLPIVDAAVAAGHRVTVCLPADGPLGVPLRAGGARVLTCPAAWWMGERHRGPVSAVRIVQALAASLPYRRLLRRARPDLVVTTSVVVPAGAVAARLARCPHAWLVQESFATNPSLNSLLPPRAVAWAVRRLSTRVVAVSGYVAGQLDAGSGSVDGQGGHGVVVVPPPVTDSELVRQAPQHRRRRGVLRNLVLLGSFSADKGQADAIAAVAACRDRGVQLRLRLLGTGRPSARAHLTDRIAAAGLSGQVTVEPWSPDPSSALEQADALLMLSRNEAFGRVTVESLAFGLPVLGYAAGATVEILRAGGGRLCPPGPEALAGLLTHLAEDDDAYRQVAGEAAGRAGDLSVYDGAGRRLVDLLTAPAPAPVATGAAS